MKLSLDEQFELAIKEAEIFTWRFELKALENQLGVVVKNWGDQRKLRESIINLENKIIDNELEIERRKLPLHTSFDILKDVKAAWLAKYPFMFDWDWMSKGVTERFGRLEPPEPFTESHIRIEIGHFKCLVLNYPPEIERFINGPEQRIVKRSSPSKRSIPKGPKEIDRQALIDWHKKDIADLLARKNKQNFEELIQCAIENLKEAEAL